ncbi:GNAT family N-acetyltransferase [Microbispora sp. NPDC049125]|uniref:GNAT family N-acetyltransferase n=1 Tax=Microbispora sp. NPDC049125 TaxID=3154929 RepID=UPI003466BD0F
MTGPSAARIQLDPLAVEDAEDMVEVLAGEELYAFIGGAPPTLPELRSRYARMLAGPPPESGQEWFNWIIRRLSDGRAVGTVQATLADQGRRAEIAWVVGLGWQGQGYASEAAAMLVDRLAALRVSRIEAHIHPGHEASMKVAARIGLSPTDRFDDGERLWRRDLPSGG